MTQRRKIPPGLLGPGILLVVLLAAAGTWFAFDEGFRAQRASLVETGPDEFEQRVRDYLLENPEVIAEAIQRLQERQRTAELNELQALVRRHSDELFRDPDAPVGGNPEGDATLVEFFDYNCPYCRSVAPVMIEAEAADPQLRIVYKEFPILGPNSTAAAKVALAAHRQGKYPEFHEAMMQIEGVADEASALEVAKLIGLDIERLKQDMADPKIQAMIDRNLDLAQTLRINGTPSFVAGDQILPGLTDLKTLQALIEKARKTPVNGSG